MSKLSPSDSVEDLDKCLAAARRPRRGARVAIKVGDADLKYRRVILDDQSPTARQIILAAEFEPVEQYLLFAVSEDGGLSELDLDEVIHLWKRRISKFLIFKNDRSYRFLLNRERFEWGQKEISGLVLKKLAGVKPKNFGVWLEKKDEPDLFLGDDDVACLSDEGLESFYTHRIFYLCIEGDLIPWTEKTITTEQIAELGGWDPSEGVIEVDPDQNERTLSPGEVIVLKPGMAYGKRLKWKRGDVAGDRIEAELALLKSQYRDVEYISQSGQHWFRLEPLYTPEDCSPDEIPVVFSVTQGHPGAEPYGFFVPADVRHRGANLAAKPAPHQPPFSGNWIFLSWAPVGWRPTGEVSTGSNLWAWARTFVQRLKEGQ